MTISAKLVMELRDETKLPMMKCKEALEKSNGNKDEAIDWLRKHGIDLRERFSGRELAEGTIGLLDRVREDGISDGVLVHVGCQTDFVAKSDAFKDLVSLITVLALHNYAFTKEALLPFVEAQITEAISKLRENIAIIDVKYLEAKLPGSVIIGYNHGNVAGLVAGTGDHAVLKHVVLHVVSASPAPKALGRLDIDPELVSKERSILEFLPDVASKPEAIRPKILDGKMSKFYKNFALLEQEMLIGDTVKGETVIRYIDRKGVVIESFARLSV